MNSTPWSSAGRASPVPGPSAAERSRWKALLLGVTLVLASLPRLTAALLDGTLWGAQSPLLYQAATLSFNYFEFGPVRRGLGGTLVFLLSRDPLTGTAGFHLLSAVAVAACFVAMASRMADAGRRWAFLALAFGLMLRWGDDPGRIDMAVAVALAAAAWALQRRRPVLAGSVLGAALLMHESALIFGAPLLVALAWRFPPGQRLSARQLTLLGGTLAVWGLLYVGLPHLAYRDTQWMVDTLRSRMPASRFVDMALYFAVSGPRGVAASLCQNRIDPAYGIHLLGAGVVLAAAAALLRCRARELGPLLLATLVPLLFLSTVANDHARWAMLAVFNLWVVCAWAPVPARPRPFAWGPPLLLAACFVALTLPALGRVYYPIYIPSPLLERAVQRLGGPRSPGIHDALPRCDPAWRSVLGAAPAQPRRNE